MRTVHTVSLLFVCLFFVLVIPLQPIITTAESDYIKIEKNVLERKPDNTYVKINGHVTGSYVDVLVSAPDGTTSTATSKLVKNTLSYFINLEKFYPAGLYTIEIISYDEHDTIVNNLTTHFMFLDADGLIDIEIEKNASVDCAPTVDSYGNPLRDKIACTSPANILIAATFGVNFINNDYKTHNLQFAKNQTGQITPDSEHVMFFAKSGEKPYHCAYHPWVKGMIDVQKIGSIHYTASPPLTIPDAINHDPTNPDPIFAATPYDLTDCGKCYVGKITGISDGDTVSVDGKSIRLALANAPEKNQSGFSAAKMLVEDVCHVGSSVLVDIDDVKPKDSYGKPIAKIICGATNINAALLESDNAVPYKSFCKKTEFVDELWGAYACGVKIPGDDSEILGSVANLEVPQVLESIVLLENGTDVIVSITSDANVDVVVLFSIVVIVLVGIIVGMIVAMMMIKRKPSKSLRDTADSDDDSFIYLR